MAGTKIAHKPDLTKEQEMEIFRQHFAGKYEVVPTSGLARAQRHFIVNKNGCIGLYVRLEQTDNETKFVYSGAAPSFLAGMVVYGTLGTLGYVLWNAITR